MQELDTCLKPGIQFGQLARTHKEPREAPSLIVPHGVCASRVCLCKVYKLGIFSNIVSLCTPLAYGVQGCVGHRQSAAPAGACLLPRPGAGLCRPHSLSLSLPHSFTHTLSLARARPLIHSLTLSLSLSRARSLSFSLSLSLALSLSYSSNSHL